MLAPTITNTAYFENIEYHIQRELSQAKQSIKICVAWISWKKYNATLEKLLKKGVQIEILYNADGINAKNFVQPDPAINLYAIKGRSYGSLMHNKFCIIDDSTVITGSFNWSVRAHFHFENIVIIKNDFRLVKKFLHEFADLKAYFLEYKNKTKIPCERKISDRCRSESYNLGILGEESGLHDESLVDIWNICLKGNHITFVGERHENYLHSHLGLKHEPDWDYYEDDDDDANFFDLSTMQREFEKERKYIHKLQDYFAKTQNIPIHALGIIEQENADAHIKWGEPPEYVINVIWRNMYYRKLIPDILYDGDMDIDDIIHRHI